MVEKGLGQTVLQEDKQMTNKVVERFSFWLANRAEQIMSTVGCHSTSTQMAFIKEFLTRVGKDVHYYGHYLWNCEMVQHLRR